MNLNRKLLVAAAGYTARAETLNGRDYLAVPVVGLREGVVHALNSKHGPEFVPAPVFQRGVHRWENKPLFEGHPLYDGKPVRGDTPAMLPRSIGLVRQPGIKDAQLTMEAWLDVKRCEERAPAMLARARAGDPIEISVGVLVASEEAEGEYEGRAYHGAWTDMDPDHLALLPDGVLGACSRAMGCGVRAAQAADLQTLEASPDELYVLWPDGAGDDDHGRAVKEYNRAASRASRASADAHQATYNTRNTNTLATHEAAERAHRDANYAQSDAAAAANRAGFKSAVAAHRFAANEHQETMRTHKDKALRTAQETNVTHMYEAWLEAGSEDLLRTLRDIPQSVRDQMPKGDFAGPNESFPIEQPTDVADAATSLGRAKGDRAAIKKRVVAIAYRKGSSFVAQLPDDWRKKTDLMAAAGFAGFMRQLRGMFQHGQADEPRDAQRADEMGRNALMGKLYDALREVESMIVNVEDYYPVTDPAHVVYTCYDGSSFTTYERPFDLADSGVVTLGDRKIEVEAVTIYEPVEGATALQENTDDLEALWADKDGNDDHGRGAANAHRLAATAHDKAQAAHMTARSGETADKKQARVATKQASNATAKAFAEAQGGDVPPDAIANANDRAEASDVAAAIADLRDDHSAAARFHANASRAHMKAARSYRKTDLQGNAGTGAPGSRGQETPDSEGGANDMDKNAIVKFLETATECQLKALGAFVEAGAKPVEVKAEVKQPTAEELRAAEDARKAEVKAAVDTAMTALTFDQVLAKADAGTRDSIATGRALGEAKKAATIAALQATKRCDHTEDELKAMNQAQLDRLVKLAGDVRAAVDFGGQGAPRDGDAAKEVAPAPDLGDRIRAAQAAKK